MAFTMIVKNAAGVATTQFAAGDVISVTLTVRNDFNADTIYIAQLLSSNGDDLRDGRNMAPGETYDFQFSFTMPSSSFSFYGRLGYYIGEGYEILATTPTTTVTLPSVPVPVTWLQLGSPFNVDMNLIATSYWLVLGSPLTVSVPISSSGTAPPLAITPVWLVPAGILAGTVILAMAVSGSRKGHA